MLLQKHPFADIRERVFFYIYERNSGGKPLHPHQAAHALELPESGKIYKQLEALAGMRKRTLIRARKT